MLEFPNTHEMIREAQSALGTDATNKDIKQYCKDNYGVEPISQTIYSAIGSEYSRQAERITAKELSDSKKFVRKSFDGDKDKAAFAIGLIGKIK